MNNSEQKQMITVKYDGKLISIDLETYTQFKKDSERIYAQQKTFASSFNKLDLDATKIFEELESLEVNKSTSKELESSTLTNELYNKAQKIRLKLEVYRERFQKFCDETKLILNDFEIAIGLTPSI